MQVYVPSQPDVTLRYDQIEVSPGICNTPTLYILVDYVCNRDLVNVREKTRCFLFFAPVAEDDWVSGSLYDAGPTAVC